MLITHVTFSVSIENSPLAIDTLTKEITVVRAMKGCIAFTPFQDPTNEQDVGVIHEWESAEDFAAYVASDSFTKIQKILRPIMVAPPVSKRFDAILIDT